MRLRWQQWRRLHWEIENCLHWVRDVTFDEAPSILRVGRTHRVMATFRNLAISLLRANDFLRIDGTLRHFVAQPDLAIRAVHTAPSIWRVRKP